jgi:hypothetical protein
MKLFGKTINPKYIGILSIVIGILFIFGIFTLIFYRNIFIQYIAPSSSNDKEVESEITISSKTTPLPTIYRGKLVLIGGSDTSYLYGTSNRSSIYYSTDAHEKKYDITWKPLFITDKADTGIKVCNQIKYNGFMWAVVGEGENTFACTTDISGKVVSWKLSKIFTRSNCLDWSSKYSVWIVGGLGGISRTTNGESWVPVPNISIQECTAIKCTNLLTVVGGNWYNNTENYDSFNIVYTDNVIENNWKNATLPNVSASEKELPVELMSIKGNYIYINYFYPSYIENINKEPIKIRISMLHFKSGEVVKSFFVNISVPILNYNTIQVNIKYITNINIKGVTYWLVTLQEYPNYLVYTNSDIYSANPNWFITKLDIQLSSCFADDNYLYVNAQDFGYYISLNNINSLLPIYPVNNAQLNADFTNANITSFNFSNKIDGNFIYPGFTMKTTEIIQSKSVEAIRTYIKSTKGNAYFFDNNILTLSTAMQKISGLKGLDFNYNNNSLLEWTNTKLYYNSPNSDYTSSNINKVIDTGNFLLIVEGTNTVSIKLKKYSDLNIFNIVTLSNISEIFWDGFRLVYITTNYEINYIELKFPENSSNITYNETKLISYTSVIPTACFQINRNTFSKPKIAYRPKVNNINYRENEWVACGRFYYNRQGTNSISYTTLLSSSNGIVWNPYATPSNFSYVDNNEITKYNYKLMPFNEVKYSLIEKSTNFWSFIGFISNKTESSKMMKNKNDGSRYIMTLKNMLITSSEIIYTGDDTQNEETYVGKIIIPNPTSPSQTTNWVYNLIITDSVKAQPMIFDEKALTICKNY